jgi:hypothetical protein
MPTIGVRLREWTAFLLLCSHSIFAQPTNDRPVPESPSSIYAASRSPVASYSASTCPARTINYITHTLPQQCLRTSWTAPTQTAPPGASEGNGVPASTAWRGIPWVREERREDILLPSQEADAVVDTSTPQVAAESSPAVTEVEGEIETDSPFDNANFLSFEEWKKKNLVRAGQSPENVGQGRAASSESRNSRRPVNVNALDSLGEEAEIDIDFSGFGNIAEGDARSERPPTGTKSIAESPTSGDEGDNVAPTSFSLSKDAGKTCKERFNFASFDCAATVLKTNKQSKSSSAVLVESKDRYMLNECSAQNKFIIVELCDDILVDTVVLANYEFFSSMFRHFRISVSDRYPVKMERWKNLGTFEARNSRELQPFLITEPQIWARYLRVEFITHYGNEFYCPISLLRVHGTTMMEQFRREEEEARGDYDFSEPIEAAHAEPVKTAAAIHDSRDIPTQRPGKRSDHETEISTNIDRPYVSAVMDTPVKSSDNESLPGSSEPSASRPNGAAPPNNLTRIAQDVASSSEVPASVRSSHSMISDGVHSRTISHGDSTINEPHPVSESVDMFSSHAPQKVENVSTAIVSSAQTVNVPTGPSTIRTASDPTANGSQTPSQSRNPAQTQPIQATPTTQESFFKSIHKRLQHLEANSTLSLQYIEEQSRILRDAFVKVEKRQLQKTERFLAQLNTTVMQELKSYRSMYEQLWQSTVIELEGMKERQHAEMGEVGARLSLLADELVWQKRMAVVQSTLLLLCLVLILFVRSGTLGGQSDAPLAQRLGNKYTQIFDSPPRSPAAPGTIRRRRTFRNMWRSDASTGLSDGVTVVSDAETEVLRSPLHIEFSPPTPTTPSAVSDPGGEAGTPGLHGAHTYETNGNGSSLPTPPSERGQAKRIQDLATQSSPATPRGSRDNDPSREQTVRAVDLLKVESPNHEELVAGTGKWRKRSPLRRAHSYESPADELDDSPGGDESVVCG